LPQDTVVVGIFLTDFHSAWPWSDQRWRFVAQRMAELASLRWQGDAASIGAALQGARQVRSVDEPHLRPWLARWAGCEAAPTIFPMVDRRCDSFSQWWNRVSRGVGDAAELLTV
jgi:deoxyribodipyrimidine photo-lyase